MLVQSLFYLAAAVAAAPTGNADSTVSTTSGRVSGHAAPGTKGTVQYIGVPYAKSPSGNLRFAPPERVAYSKNVFDANLQTTCPSLSLYGPEGFKSLPHANTTNVGVNGERLIDILGNTGFTNDEDCLRLNIWTRAHSPEKKAVMLFIYGGGVNFGTTADPRYNGRHLADTEDVVVVTINYRTNLFGFPGAPNTRQNLGYLDQRSAIEWVRDNIEAFGGDPKRITLFGQSAGAGSQDYYSLAYTHDPIVASFIPQSGSLLTNKGITPEAALEPWYNATSKLGCGDSKSDQNAALACMRRKSVDEIMKALAGKPGLGSIEAAMQFAPVTDDITVFSNSSARFHAGQFIRKPVLYGSTEQETNVEQPTFKAIAGKAVPQPLLDIINAGRACVDLDRANYSTAAAVKTWRYRWFGYWDNTALSLGDDASLAYHESELSTVFGTSADFGPRNTPAQDAIQKEVMGAWAAFAKDPEAGLSKLGWPEYTAKNQQVVRLAFENRTGTNLIDAAKLDAAKLDAPCFEPGFQERVKNATMKVFGSAGAIL